MIDKKWIAAGIILARVVMTICGIGLYRQIGGSGTMDATIELVE